ncbi:hypothetical protein MRB53_040369 [Persea americana]|nr:hypothetical protein MRB53_040369 [Persea americana]
MATRSFHDIRTSFRLVHRHARSFSNTPRIAASLFNLAALSNSREGHFLRKGSGLSHVEHSTRLQYLKSLNDAVHPTSRQESSDKRESQTGAEREVRHDTGRGTGFTAQVGQLHKPSGHRQPQEGAEVTCPKAQGGCDEMEGGRRGAAGNYQQEDAIVRIRRPWNIIRIYRRILLLSFEGDRPNEENELKPEPAPKAKVVARVALHVKQAVKSSEDKAQPQSSFLEQYDRLASSLGWCSLSAVARKSSRSFPFEARTQPDAAFQLRSAKRFRTHPRGHSFAISG